MASDRKRDAVIEDDSSTGETSPQEQVFVQADKTG